MTVTELVQLYAPLCGLLGVVFWLGVLSQKVKNLEDCVATLKRDHTDGDNSDRLIRVEVKMEAMSAELSTMSRAMQGVQRQLGNLMKPGSPIHDFGGG
jgi:hypothetical protein